MKSPSRNDGAKARAWRQRHNLSVIELSDLTGYSIESIYRFERGEAPPRTWSDRKHKQAAGPIPVYAWQRYKRVCQGVEHELQNGEFDW